MQIVQYVVENVQFRCIQAAHENITTFRVYFRDKPRV